MGQISGTALTDRQQARIMVLLFLGTMVGGFFGELYVPAKLIVAGDAAATAHNILTHAVLFRVGFAGYLLEAMCDIGLLWMFYLLLRPVHRDLALLSAFFGIVATATFASAESFYFAALGILRDGGSLGVFTPEQRAGLTMLSLKFYGAGTGISMLFYGVASSVRGYLIYRSGYLPAFIGALFMLAGTGFIARSLMLVLYPRAAFGLFLLPMFAAVVSLMVWLVVKGVHVPNEVRSP